MIRKDRQRMLNAMRAQRAKAAKARQNPPKAPAAWQAAMRARRKLDATVYTIDVEQELLILSNISRVSETLPIKEKMQKWLNNQPGAKYIGSGHWRIEDESLFSLILLKFPQKISK